MYPALAAARRRLPAAQLLLHPTAVPSSPSPSARTCSRCWCSSLVAVAVSVIVDLAARRTREAARARAEAETLSTLAGSVLRGSRPLPALLDQLRETFGFTGVTPAGTPERRPARRRTQRHDPTAWQVAAAVGDRPVPDPGRGRRRHPGRRGPHAGAARAPARGRRPAGRGGVRRPGRGRAAPGAARRGGRGGRSRSPRPTGCAPPCSSAVSHDLRTPLASAKAAVDQPAQPRRRLRRRTTATSCSPPPTSPSTG